MPAASRATARIRWGPLAVKVVFHGKLACAVVEIATRTSSTNISVVMTRLSSVAEAWRLTTPAADAGTRSVTVGGVVSPAALSTLTVLATWPVTIVGGL